MLEWKIYISGLHYGLYGSGAVVLARRDDSPGVERGKFYTIAEVVDTGMGKCGKNLLIRLVGVPGEYVRNTFSVNEECKARMQNR
jgi:hypothetical protein